MRTLCLLFLLMHVSAVAQSGSVDTISSQSARPDSSMVDTSVAKPHAAPVPFEGYNPNETSIRWDHAAIVSAALAGTVTAIHIYQRNAWWKDQRTDFHFVDDNEYALNVDKAGHYAAGAFNSFLGQKAFEWSGFSKEASVWGGFAIGALFQTYVELEDGYAGNWGFSRGDAYANLIGAAWPVVQYYVPYAEHIQPKFTYWPSTRLLEGKHHGGNIIDDYEGQTYWVAVHVHGLLPKSWKSYWPDWLGIALGVSVREIENREATQRNVILALDYDMSKIIPGESWWLHTLKQALNFLHFPSPAIRISPGFVSYGLYFK